jgi:hypothetical protein
MTLENNLKTGAVSVNNHNNQTAGLRVKTRVKAGALSSNHNEAHWTLALRLPISSAAASAAEAFYGLSCYTFIDIQIYRYVGVSDHQKT